MTADLVIVVNIRLSMSDVLVGLTTSIYVLKIEVVIPRSGSKASASYSIPGYVHRRIVDICPGIYYASMYIPRKIKLSHTTIDADTSRQVCCTCILYTLHACTCPYCILVIASILNSIHTHDSYNKS